ncbi:GrpB family protein [Pullulanibacillus camelliae]|uniref:GrpB family protein n=1 Tax=Pullulanibacillus camelliae TaxID=1707096 RepID=UPI001E406498|nr:GrpB family protein [Pullulanibacillus camelliae]
MHHIGSIAVAQLSTKPILEIAGEACVLSLEELGYAYKGTDLLPERYYFSKGEPRTHHIHMCQSGNRYLLEQLPFRDDLRHHEDARRDYEQLCIKRISISMLMRKPIKVTSRKNII